MSGPSKKSSACSGKPENVLVRVERLRQQAEEFQRTVEEELRTVLALLEEPFVPKAKRRGHGRPVFGLRGCRAVMAQPSIGAPSA